MALWLIRFLDRCDCAWHDAPKAFLTGMVAGVGAGVFLGVSVGTWLMYGMH